MRRTLLALFLALAVGCGGGGGSGGQDVVDAWVSQFVSAFEAQNVSSLGGLMSNGYLDDCDTKADVLQFWQEFFVAGGTVDVSDVSASSKIITDTAAQFLFRATVRLTGPEGSFTVQADGTIFLVKESGFWREVGNQTCAEAPDNRPRKGGTWRRHGIVSP